MTLLIYFILLRLVGLEGVWSYYILGLIVWLGRQWYKSMCHNMYDMQINKAIAALQCIYEKIIEEKK